MCNFLLVRNTWSNYFVKKRKEKDTAGQKMSIQMYNERNSLRFKNKRYQYKYTMNVFPKNLRKKDINTNVQKRYSLRLKKGCQYKCTINVFP